MNFQEFDKLMDELYNKCKEIRTTKGKEYAHDADCFANFNRLASELEMPNVKIGYIYFKKHLDSIVSYINTGQEFSTESIEGRFVDAIVYLFLIYGMVKEKKLNSEKTGVIGLNKIPTDAKDVKFAIKPPIFYPGIEPNEPKPKVVASNMDNERCNTCNELFLPNQLVRRLADGKPIHSGSCPLPKKT